MDWVLLFGSDYIKRLDDVLAGGSKSIDVCMFHIAYPKEDHPTKRLLERLVDRQRAGVTVRVLLDRGDKDDPYRSTAINKPASELMAEHGIACRSDATDRLLHSKLIVVDGTKTIIGSHNWSAGSYYAYDDLSVLIESPQLASFYSKRFETLWAKGAWRETSSRGFHASVMPSTG